MRQSVNIFIRDMGTDCVIRCSDETLQVFDGAGRHIILPVEEDITFRDRITESRDIANGH